MIVLGAVIIGFRPDAFDSGLMILPSGYGIHGYDVIGTTLVMFGLILFWRRPPRTH